MTKYRNTWLGMVMALGAGVSWLAACGSESPVSSTAPAPETDAGDASTISDWDRRYYIDKVARALRHGVGISPDDDIEALVRSTPEQVVDHFMNDPKFVNTVLDFNLYFLGFRDSTLNLSSGDWSEAASLPRRAIHSALELERGGDYLSLLAREQPAYGPLPTPEAVPEKPALSDAELLRYHFDRAMEEADALLAYLDGKPSEPADFCIKLFLSNNLYQAPFTMFTSGSSYEFAVTQWFAQNTPIYLHCSAPDSFSADPATEVRKIRQYVTDFHAYAHDMLAKGSSTGNPHAIFEMAPQRIGAPQAAARLDTTTFWFELANSSTNQNRRRAAYILDRYFCDDLKPINAALPATHTGDRHAADPGCLSCHYKLDPMAGFFRNFGRTGFDMSASPKIIFDDGAEQDRAKYESNWASADPGIRAWNIGYVRSSTDPSLNAYGESLDDLFRIIQEAPEVKSCIARRAFSYFNGEQQLVDPGYLAQLATWFTVEAKENSSTAFRNLVHRVLTSHTFQARDPRSNECYDVPPGTDVASRPPCSVAYLLQKDCATCHSGPGAQAGLDLTGWLADAQTFPHKGPDGTQHTGRETFTRMLDRISTSDTARRMPAGRSMAAKDREDLYVWLTSHL